MWTDEDLRALFHVAGRPADPRRVDALMAEIRIRTRPRLRGSMKAAAAAAILTLALGASFPGSRAVAAHVAQVLQRDLFSGQVGGMRVSVIQNQGTRPVVGPSRSTGGAGPVYRTPKMTIAKARHLIPVWMGTPTLDPSRLSHTVTADLSPIFNVPGMKSEEVGFVYHVPGGQPVTVSESGTVHRVRGHWVFGGHYVGLSAVSITGANMDARVRTFAVDGQHVLWVSYGRGGRNGPRQSMMAFKVGPVQVQIYGAAASDSFMRQLVSNLLPIVPK